jgi:hypothetical protein
MDLVSVRAFDESFHGISLVPCVTLSYFERAFLHSLGRLLTPEGNY